MLRVVLFIVCVVGVIGSASMAYKEYVLYQEIKSNPRYERDKFLKDEFQKYIRPDNPGYESMLREILDRPRVASAALDITNTQGRKTRLEDAAKVFAANRTPASWDLASLAIGELGHEEEARSNFLLEYGAVLDTLEEEQSILYQRYLDEASKSVNGWVFVRDDPVGAVVWHHVKDQDLRDYYRKNREWLGEILQQLLPNPDKDGMLPGNHLVKVIEAAKSNDGFAALDEKDRTPYALALLVAYPELFRELTQAKKGTVFREYPSLLEALEVVAANPPGDVGDTSIGAEDFELPGGILDASKYLKAFDMRDPANGKRLVWNAARNFPNVIRISLLAKEYAIVLIKHFGTDDICSFLALNVPEHLIYMAAHALDKYKDLAFYILQRGCSRWIRKYPTGNGIGEPIEKNWDIDVELVINPDRDTFLMAMQKHDFRLIAYAAKKDIKVLASNPADINDVLDSDGNPRDSAWYESLPLFGAPASVARKAFNGYSVEWDDIGWAALDVVDGGLLVVSLGGTSGLTVMKQAAKAGVKEATHAVGKSLGKKALRTAGARGLARKAGLEKAGSLLSRTAARTAETTIRIGKWTLFAPFKVAGKAAERFGKLTIAKQKHYARAMLAAGLTITVMYRTLPEITRQLGGLQAKMEDKFQSIIDGMGRFVSDGATSVLGDWPSWVRPRMVGYAIMGLCCFVGAYVLRPRIPTVRHG